MMTLLLAALAATTQDTPEDALKRMTLPDGFTVNAFAAEPALVQPFAFDFDDRGRIWVSENLNYQTRGSHTNDLVSRIIILEDTDADGTFDKKKIFHDRLKFPSGLAVGFGGVWVGSPPNLLFIPDKDGDDVPDGEPRVVLDGWGINDRHETLNSFIWGPDGWLYGCHGVFTHSNVGKPGAPDGERQKINAGIWRYHPLKEKFEVFGWGTSNPWGLDFNTFGQAFVTACVIPHLYHIVQGGRFRRQSGKHFNPHVYDDIKTVADHRHKSAHGGARFYMADAFPEKYRNRLFMCNIHQHQMLTDVLQRKGSGYSASHGDEFLDSHDVKWLGFNIDIGPDGGVYVIDWHDGDICGRKVLQQQTGRLYRVATAKATRAKDLNLAALSDADLVRMQLHANDWYVRHARRILQERAAADKLDGATHAALKKLFRDAPSESKKLRALWALHVSGGADEAFLAAALSHPAEHVRAWAVQLLAEDRAVSDAVLEKWTAMASEDTSPVVRLYLASALQRIPEDKRWDIVKGLVGHEEDAEDHNIPLMIWYGLEPLVAGNVPRSLQIAQASKIPRIRSYIPRRIAAGLPPAPPVRVPVAKAPKAALLVNLQASELSDRVKASAPTHPQFEKTVAGRPALRFDGVDDRVVVSHADAITFKASQKFTLEAWVHLDGSPGGGWIGLVTKSRDKSPWYGLWIDPGRRWTFGSSGENVAGPQATSGWHHVCGVQDGASRRILYVDGKEVARGNARDGSGSGDLWIGGAKSVNEYFKGAIGTVRLWARALTAEEVAERASTP